MRLLRAAAAWARRTRPRNAQQKLGEMSNARARPKEGLRSFASHFPEPPERATALPTALRLAPRLPQPPPQRLLRRWPSPCAAPPRAWPRPRRPPAAPSSAAPWLRPGPPPQARPSSRAGIGAYVGCGCAERRKKGAGRAVRPMEPHRWSIRWSSWRAECAAGIACPRQTAGAPGLAATCKPSCGQRAAAYALPTKEGEGRRGAQATPRPDMAWWDRSGGVGGGGRQRGREGGGRTLGWRGGVACAPGALCAAQRSQAPVMRDSTRVGGSECRKGAKIKRCGGRSA